MLAQAFPTSKYGPLDKESPALFFALPELSYPPRLNAVRVLLEGALEKGLGARAAYYFGEQKITYSELAANVGKFAFALARAGLKRGDRVLLRLVDSPELVYSILAVQALGAIAIPTYVQLRPDDLIYRVQDAGIKVVVVGADLIDGMSRVEEACPGQLTILVAPYDRSRRFQSLEDLLPNHPVPVSYEETEADDIALVLYTSGSTGKPKGTLHNHRDLLAISDTYCRYCVQLTPSDIIAGPASIPFALGYGFFVVFPLRFGAAAILDADKAPETLVASISRHCATVFLAVPTYYLRLIRCLKESKIRLTSIRMALCGGEPLLPETEQEWLSLMGLPIEQFLGTTEMLHIFVTYRHGVDSVRKGAIGRPVPGYEVSVRDPDRLLPVPTGTPGLLCTRGPTGTRYWNKAEAQKVVVREGWNVFQDLVWMDEDGFVHYVARHDDMIVSAGYSISPTEVENILARHPAVMECACVPAPDPSGERASIVKAYIVARQGFSVGPDLAANIQRFFKESGPPYMYPREIEFLDSLPKTINGKIQRSELRRMRA